MSKVYLNIKDSVYKLKVDNFEFYFSSIFYLEKFKNNVENFIENERLRMYNRYRFNINMRDLLLLAFYRKTEKRGFFVIKDNKELKNISFVVNFNE